MLVKFNVDDDIAESIKKFTSESVASKAFYGAALRAERLTNLVLDLEDQVRKLTIERDVLLRTISDAHSAAKALIERTGQKDAFIN